MVNSPILYGAIMTLWLVALPGFLIISSVSGIVNVLSIVVPTVPSLHILGSMEGIIIGNIIGQWAQ